MSFFVVSGFLFCFLCVVWLAGVFFWFFFFVLCCVLEINPTSRLLRKGRAVLP